jgi:hypothetical protein
LAPGTVSQYSTIAERPGGAWHVAPRAAGTSISATIATNPV